MVRINSVRPAGRADREGETVQRILEGAAFSVVLSDDFKIARAARAVCEDGRRSDRRTGRLRRVDAARV